MVHDPLLDPLVAPTAQSGGRALLVGYPPVSAAEHQNLDELLEDHLVGDAVTVTAERMVCYSLRQEDSKLLPDGFDDVWLDGGHGEAPSRSGSFSNSPYDRASVSVLHSGHTPYWRKLLFTQVPRRDSRKFATRVRKPNFLTKVNIHLGDFYL